MLRTLLIIAGVVAISLFGYWFVWSSSADAHKAIVERSLAYYQEQYAKQGVLLNVQDVQVRGFPVSTEIVLDAPSLSYADRTARYDISLAELVLSPSLDKEKRFDASAPLEVRASYTPIGS
ncbi:MAG: hypothetical protein CMM94_03910, partial [Rickettsiales bacterium]|nr:hypothetical protein [Rickettsiales bacterium]